MLNLPYQLILASQSPRRQQLLSDLDIPFTTLVIKDIDESYPKDLPAKEVAAYLSQKKAAAYRENLNENALVITADTIVIADNKVLGKPKDQADAVKTLQTLSGKTHLVITGVTLTTQHKSHTFSAITEVTFSPLEDDEINYYLEKYKPYDKAGAYGIQEWIGSIGVEHINGSYFNVMGLPVHQLYQALKNF